MEWQLTMRQNTISVCIFHSASEASNSIVKNCRCAATQSIRDITKSEWRTWRTHRTRASLRARCLPMKSLTAHSLRYRTPLSIYFHLSDRRWVLPGGIVSGIYLVRVAYVLITFTRLGPGRAGSSRPHDSISPTNRKTKKNTNKIEIKIISFVRTSCWRKISYRISVLASMSNSCR